MPSLSSGVFRALRPLVLASASPRRRAFLHELGIDCRMVCPPEAAEPLPLPGEDPGNFAARAACSKAVAVREMLRAEGPESAAGAVLGADTVVFCEGSIFGKPKDEDEAFAFLRCLAGREHTVRTACCLSLANGESVPFYGEARVTIGAWPDPVLAAYAAGGEGLDKAGAYAVQGVGSFLVERVSGSWSAVVGLPVAEAVGVLLERGLIGPAPVRAQAPLSA